MEEIRISLPEVSSCASTIRVINASLDDTLSNISGSMRELTGVWKGTAGESIVSRFQKYATKFIDESETIEEYAKFLDYIVSTYDSIETTLTTNASNFE
ncbi:MAG: WXG100 family type VII secretion target [Erysipelotrichaceae bacterium]|nr:WXG100 family type VII secretion target [Erysipelotrichaceae bacterium]